MSADNYDEFLKALNVGFLLRKVGSSQKFGFHPQKGRRLSKVSVSSSERWADFKSFDFLLRKVGSSQMFRFHPQKGRQLSKVSVSSSERYAALKSLSFLLGRVGSTEFEKVKKLLMFWVLIWMLS